MKYFSMFSGIGGFEKGIEQSGVDMECIGYSEIDKYAVSIYERHYPNHINWGDATEINPKELPDFDFLVGGFPCQAFSLAGKRKGFDDTRGTLFFEIARILREKRPRYFLLENVKGLLSHDKGQTFKTILGVLAELGYDVEWEVLNSKNFGVPQNRERIFLKGYFRAECGREILSQKRNSREIISKMIGNYGQRTKEGKYKIGDHDVNGVLINDKTLAVSTVDGDSFAVTTRNRQNPLPKKEDNYVINSSKGFDLLSCASDGNVACLDANYHKGIGPSDIKKNRRRRTQVIEKKESKIKKCYGSTQKHRAETDGSYSPTLTSAMGEGGGHVPMVETENEPEFVRMHGSNQEHRMISEDTCCALNTHRTPMVEFDKPLKIRTAIDKGYVEADVNDGVRLDHPNSNTRRGTVQKESTGALSCNSDWGTVDKDFRIRRLTPKECERLQGFPDDWTKYGKDDDLISDTQRYKCCGNAVTVNVIEFLIRSMFG